MADRLQPPESNVSNETIAQFAIEVDKAQRDIDEATGKKRAILLRAKKAGIETKDLLVAIAWKKTDPDALLVSLRNQLRYAIAAAPSLPLTQDDLFDGIDTKPLNVKTKTVQSAWEAERAGYEAGLNGGTMDDATYPPGTENHTHFFNGWTRGQRVIAERMGENAKKADASLTKKRGGKSAAEVKAEREADGRQYDIEKHAHPAGNA